MSKHDKKKSETRASSHQGASSQDSLEAQEMNHSPGILKAMLHMTGGLGDVMSAYSSIQGKKNVYTLATWKKMWDAHALGAKKMLAVIEKEFENHHEYEAVLEAFRQRIEPAIRTCNEVLDEVEEENESEQTKAVEATEKKVVRKEAANKRAAAKEDGTKKAPNKTEEEAATQKSDEPARVAATQKSDEAARAARKAAKKAARKASEEEAAREAPPSKKRKA